jgi:hypothetical protein
MSLLLPSVEGTFAGEHVIKDSAKRELVAPRIDQLAAQLFRSHLREGFRDRVRQILKSCYRLGRGEELSGLRNAEIEQLHAVFGQHDIVWLQIAMHDGGVMRCA